MKRILILAYNFPPRNIISAQRPESWFKHFKELGYYPVVITRHWDSEVISEIDSMRHSRIRTVEEEVASNGTIYRAPFTPNLRNRHYLRYGHKLKPIRNLFGLINLIGQYFFPILDEKYPIYKTAKFALKKEKFSAIIATGNPFILFKYAHKLSRRFSVPWVADYRDGWTTDIRLTYADNITKLISSKIERPLEKHYLKSAKLVTTASPSYSDDLKKIFRNLKTIVIYNGYTDEDFKLSDNQQIDEEEFIISYIGSIYPFQPIEVFLEGLKQFLNKNSKVKIRLKFLGLNYQEDQKERVLNYYPKLMDCIECTDRLDHSNVLREAAKSHLLLLLSDTELINLSAKIFNYLRLKRRIILVKNDRSVLNSIIDDCKAGIACDTSTEVCQALENLYEKFENGSSFHNETMNYEKYSRKHQSERMIQYLRKVIEA